MFSEHWIDILTPTQSTLMVLVRTSRVHAFGSKFGVNVASLQQTGTSRCHCQVFVLCLCGVNVTLGSDYQYGVATVWTGLIALLLLQLTRVASMLGGSRKQNIILL